MGWAKDFAEGLSGGLAQPIKELVSEFITDKDKANELANKVTMTVMEHADKEADRAHNEVIAQLEINKVQAQHGSLFVAGARPAAIWVCVLALFSMLILIPWASYLVDCIRLWNALDNFGNPVPIPPPEIDSVTLFTVLGPLLGLGAARTYERLKGVERNMIKGVSK